MTDLKADITDAWLAPVKRRGDLIEVGYSDRAIRRLVKGGVLAKLRWGAYAEAASFLPLDSRGRHALVSRAVLLQANAMCSLSHSSALLWHGAPGWGLDLSTVHITRHDQRAGRREAGVTQHRGRILEGDVLERHGISITSPTRSALEIATIADVETSLVQVNHLLHTGKTSLEALVKRQALMDDWPFSLATQIVLRLADGRIESVGETRIFYLCYRFSLPMPQPQFVVSTVGGREVARLDFAWPELGKYLEFDGKIKYEKLLKPGQRASDVVLREKKRDALVHQLTGFDGMRTDWSDLENPVRTATRLKEFLFDE